MTSWILKYNNNQFYFGNVDTNKSQWIIPSGTILTQLLNPGWIMYMKQGNILFKNKNKESYLIPVKSGKWSMHYENNICWFYDENTQKSQWFIPSGDIDTDMLNIPWKMYYANNQIYFRSGNIVKCDIPCDKSINCSTIRGLKWTGNSCYLDSVLVALFAVPSKYTNTLIYGKLSETDTCIKISPKKDLENRYKIQEQLRLISESIHGDKVVETCFNLRTTLRNCPHSEQFWDTNIKDAGEFLLYLLSLFPNLPYSHMNEKMWITNRIDDQHSTMLINDRTDTKHYVTWSVDSNTLLNSSKNTKISSFLEQTIVNTFDKENLYKHIDPITGIVTMYSNLITLRKLVYSPYVIFNLLRRDVITNKIIIRSIIPEFSIKIGTMIYLLSSIVVLLNAHYTCYFRCKDIWYYYDDVGGMYNIKEIGGYNSLLEAEPSVKSRGTLYFYTPSKN
jgi:hypothetical protein